MQSFRLLLLWANISGKLKGMVCSGCFSSVGKRLFIIIVFCMIAHEQLCVYTVPKLCRTACRALLVPEFFPTIDILGTITNFDLEKFFE